MTPLTPNKSTWYSIPLKTQVRILGVLCYYANFLDAVLTAKNLMRGDWETNLLMRFLWNYSPWVYATGKFFLFWLGMTLIKKYPRGPREQWWCYLGTFLVYFGIDLWHLWLHF